MRPRAIRTLRQTRSLSYPTIHIIGNRYRASILLWSSFGRFLPNWFCRLFRYRLSIPVTRGGDSNHCDTRFIHITWVHALTEWSLWSVQPLPANLNGVLRTMTLYVGKSW